jgi:hypothetical protein
MAEEKNRISRREFLKDAGLIVGGATVGSMAFMSACGGSATATVTENQDIYGNQTATVTGANKTVTTTVTSHRKRRPIQRLQ